MPELRLSRGVGQSGYHHLDTLGHVFEVVERVGSELSGGDLGASVPEDRHDALLLAALLHDLAKPLTRGELSPAGGGSGRVVFVAHDTVGAELARSVCAALGASALQTDAATTLTALHLKIGFMQNERTDHPPGRLVLAAGPFGEELAVLSWADRLAAQGSSLTEEQLRNHRDLCLEFLEASRTAGPHPEPDYGVVRRAVADPGVSEAGVGYLAGRVRNCVVRGMDPEEAVSFAVRFSGRVAGGR